MKALLQSLASQAPTGAGLEAVSVAGVGLLGCDSFGSSAGG